MTPSSLADSLSLESSQTVQLHDLAALRGRFSGPVFLIASGPSVLQFPIQRYRQWPMMAMNGSIQRFVDEGLKPLFYLCDDRGVAVRKGVAVSRGVVEAEHAVLGFTALKEVAKHSPEALEKGCLYLLQRVNRPLSGGSLSDRRFAWRVRNDPDYVVEWSLFHQKRNRIGFSKNLSNGCFNGRTIAYAALQLAYHLGFDQVFLVGVDMNPELGQFYDPEGKIVPSRLGDDYADYILPSFELMAQCVLSPGFQVFNLSAQSRIPDTMVPKVTLEQLDALLPA